MKTIHTLRRRQIEEFNDIFSCYLCNGYMINPTTVDICLHTYCRSCIVKQLQQNDSFCPQCKTKGGKQISISNLKSDDVLRSVIYKLVPGLYQKERERILQFINGLRNGQNKLELQNDCKLLESDDEFFAPTEPISLSLEYHPALLLGCTDSQIPSTRYLQCPASVKIQHLKRFLCSKYDIDPENDRVQIDVIYDEDVLPNDFSLMDVGYCYNWRRSAPMKFRYRILLFNDDVEISEEISPRSVTAKEITSETKNSILHQQTENDKSKTSVQYKNVSFPSEPTSTLLFKGETEIASAFVVPVVPPVNTAITLHKIKHKSKNVLEIKEPQNTKTDNKESGECVSPAKVVMPECAPVKVLIARKSTESKKPSPKRTNHDDPTTTYTVTSDFKSLRSNDMRYRDYFATPATTTTPKVIATTNVTATIKSPPKSGSDASESSGLACATTTAAAPSTTTATIAKCDIVVSIPHSQIPKSPFSADEPFENVSLAQLKTASKKSPTSTQTSSCNFIETTSQKKSKNVPKLKIELNNLKTKLSIPKPKSADARFEEPEVRKSSSKYRKYSLDEIRPTPDKLDIETYAKNIGLKPIEVWATALDSNEKSKYSPNASPMSTSSCSTTSSSSHSGGNPSTTAGAEVLTSFHKKRKKKHSKDSKNSRDSKRRKLHAEISSQPADESLKMKVKLTAPQPHSHKSHKLSSDKKSSSSNGETAKLVAAEHAFTVLENKTISTTTPETLKTNSLLNTSSTNNTDMKELNKTLCEESVSINKLMKNKLADLPKAEIKLEKLKEKKLQTNVQFLKKPIVSIKNIKLPSSPPLPPSLFKTSAMPFTTLTATQQSVKTATTTQNQLQEQTTSQTASSTTTVSTTLRAQPFCADKPGTKHKMYQQFVVPNPPRPITNSQKFFSAAPSSIASSVNKQVQLKRSASLDEANNLKLGAMSKQQKLEQDRLKRKSAYGAFLGSSSHQLSTAPLPKYQITSSHKDNKVIASKVFEKPYYTPITASYGSKYDKRKTPAVKSSFTNFGKANETNNTTTQLSNATAGVNTSSPRQRPNTTSQAQLSLLPFGPQRMQSNQVTPDIVPLMGPPTNSVLKNKKVTPLVLSPTSTFRSPSAATAVTKNNAKSPTLTSTTILPQLQSQTSLAITSPSYRSSPPALVNIRNSMQLFATSSKSSDSKKIDESKTNGAVNEKPKSSLRDFRPTFKDGNVDILDLSSSKIQDVTKECTSTAPVLSTGGSSLEAALNKIKQNISSCAVADKTAASIATSSSTPKSSSSSDSNSDDLQNLHLLSESATAREKIAIQTTTATLLDKSKLTSQSALMMVRQQNPSVRNIPNPSALAFRNPPTVPCKPTINKTSPIASPTVTSPPCTPSTKIALGTAAVPALTIQNNASTTSIVPTSTAQSTTPSVPIANMTVTSTSSGTATSTVTTQSPPRFAIKKPTTIDQVAANLNIRAAAAEASAAKATALASSSNEESATQVTSTSTTLADNQKSDTNSPKICEKVKTTVAAKTTVNAPTSSSTKDVEKSSIKPVDDSKRVEILNVTKTLPPPLSIGSSTSFSLNKTAKDTSVKSANVAV